MAKVLTTLNSEIVGFPFKIDCFIAHCSAMTIKPIMNYKTMKKVMCEYGGVESPSVKLENKEEKRVWVKTSPEKKK